MNDTVNQVSLPVIIALVVMIFAAMTGRLVRSRIEGRRIPLLLKRDWLIFAALAVLAVGTVTSRLTGIRLGQELWWVLLTNTLAISALVVWAAIEFRVIGRGDA